MMEIFENFAPLILSFYVGSWSDRFGRKPFLFVCMLCKTLSAGGNLLAGLFMDGFDRWAWLAVYMPLQSVSWCLVMMSYCFITDNSLPR